MQLKKKKKKPSGYLQHWGPVDDHNEPSSRVSILDCRSNTWREGPSMLVKRNFPHANYNIISTSAGIDGKVHIFGSCNGLAYDTREGRWESVGMEMSSDWVWYSYCVVDNVIYCYDNEGEFKWYDTKLNAVGHNFTCVNLLALFCDL
ncbi:hypothetical protein Bca52824_090621 [Brassica carinata]|uniref:F-box/kelch-repeat protein n=1 Tax=Brassica carinata TaxID=52824 RepID=A0A8X7TG69_BRACI|nr:hypothetical protein Bca52824_090621 [Brassica carinata]